MKYPVIISFILLLQGCAKDLYQPHKASVSVDGIDDEWERKYYRKVKDANMVYAVASDGDRLYLLVKATEKEEKRRLMMLGMTVWIDGKGKKSKRQGIQYPQGIMDDLVMNAVVSRFKQSRNGREWDENHRELMYNPEVVKLLERNKNNIGLINFFDDSDEAYTYPLSDLKVPIEAKFTTSQSGITYELAIPMDLIKKQKKNTISIGLETNTIDIKELMAGRGAGMRPGMGRGTGFGGRGRPMPNRGGGQMQQRRAQFQQMNQPIKEWLKVKID